MEPVPHIEQDNDGGDYRSGLRERMYTLAKSLTAPTIVELGTRTGNSLRIWVAACASNGGQVYSIDCVLRYLSPPPQATLIVGSTQTVQWDTPIDLLYIDADHSAESFRHDLTKFYPYVKAGGHVLIHDITNIGHCADMVPILAMFCEANSLTWETWPNQCGIAHLVKP